MNSSLNIIMISCFSHKKTISLCLMNAPVCLNWKKQIKMLQLLKRSRFFQFPIPAQRFRRILALSKLNPFLVIRCQGTRFSDASLYQRWMDMFSSLASLPAVEQWTNFQSIWWGFPNVCWSQLSIVIKPWISSQANSSAFLMFLDTPFPRNGSEFGRNAFVSLVYHFTLIICFKKDHFESKSNFEWVYCN